MKKFGYAMVAGMMFFFLGWIFIRTTWTLAGVLICVCLGWVVTKIDEERS